MSITVCPMAEKHIEGIYALEQQCFAQPWSREAMHEELGNRFARYLVLLEQERVVGYGGMWIILDEAHITNIAIHSDCRRQHLGSGLMRALMHWAVQEGAVSMTLEVRVSNTPAIALYESLGFTAAGVRKGYYSDNGEDALIMWNERILQEQRVFVSP